MDSVLWLSGHGNRSAQLATNIRTIGGSDAVKACRKIFPAAIAGDAKDVETAMRVRNAATHMALVDVHELRSAMKLMVRLVDSLLDAMGWSREAFWGEGLSVADLLLDQAQAEAVLSVEMKIHGARARMADLGSHPGVGALDSLSGLAYERIFSNNDVHREPTECPACGHEGVILCRINYRATKVDDQGAPIYAKFGSPFNTGVQGVPIYEKFGRPFCFECVFCKLRFDETGELAAAKLDKPVNLGQAEDGEILYALRELMLSRFGSDVAKSPPDEMLGEV